MGRIIISNNLVYRDPEYSGALSLPKSFEDIKTDFKLPCGVANLCRFSRIKSNCNYLPARIRNLKTFSSESEPLKAMFLVVEKEEDLSGLEEVNIQCVLEEVTLLVVTQPSELEGYLRGYTKSRQQATYLKPKDLLVAVKGVNETDAANLLSTFGNLANLFQATEAQLRAVKGIGPLKAKNLSKVFHMQ